MPAPKVIALKGWNHKKYIQKSGLAHPPKKHRTFDYETYMFCNQKSYVYISKHLYFKNGQLSVPQRITIGRSTAACRSEINRQYTVQPNALKYDSSSQLKPERFLFSIFRETVTFISFKRRKGSIVFYHTDHIEEEFASHFCTLLYSTGLDIVDIDDSVSISLGIHTNVSFFVEYNRTL